MPSPEEENAEFTRQLLDAWDREMGPYTSDEVINLMDGAGWGEPGVRITETPDGLIFKVPTSAELARLMLGQAEEARAQAWLEILS